MKKKRKLRFLSSILCFAFLLFTGCTGGGPNGILELESNSLKGVKALTRPSDYSFADAVGEFSEKYYNLFAQSVLDNLYSVYEDMSYLDYNVDEIFNGLQSQDNEITFSNVIKKDENKYFLYDSLRFTIKSVETTKDLNGYEISKIMTIDENAGWNWTIKPIAFVNEKNYGTAFENYKMKRDDASLNKMVKYTFDEEYFSRYPKWFDIYTNISSPSFKEIYVGQKILKNAEAEITDYWTSPYRPASASSANDLNFYQDALEYATYLFVLGYDYQKVDENGVVTPTEEAEYFNFTPQFSNNGLVEDIKVGWKNQNVSIVQALDEVKNLYEEIGGFVGLSDQNIKSLNRFVLDKIIGQSALAENQFSVKEVVYSQTSNNVPVLDSESTIKFNRNYEKIVENIINIACTKAPIGKDENGNLVTLEDRYVASTITDFSGNYFFPNYENNSDEEMFKYIDAGEYQSLIFYPEDGDIGKQLSDIWLIFEYFDNPNNQTNLTELTINVGLRYFNSSAKNGDGEVTFSKETQLKVKYGKNGRVEGENPDVNWVYMGSSVSEADRYDINFQNIIMQTSFNNSIAGGAINPFVDQNSVVSPDRLKASKTINGSDKAKDFYQINPSSSYGSYATLKEDEFSVNKAGADACDFIEIYFDIVKEKGQSNINYNFKPCLYLFTAQDVV